MLLVLHTRTHVKKQKTKNTKQNGATAQTHCRYSFTPCAVLTYWRTPFFVNSDGRSVRGRRVRRRRGCTSVDPAAVVVITALPDSDTAAVGARLLPAEAADVPRCSGVGLAPEAAVEPGAAAVAAAAAAATARARFCATRDEARLMLGLMVGTNPG